MHCNLKAARHRASCSVFSQFCTAHAHKLNCYLPASNRNCDIAIRFNNPDSLKDHNNLVIRRRFHAVTLTFDS